MAERPVFSNDTIRICDTPLSGSYEPRALEVLEEPLLTPPRFITPFRWDSAAINGTVSDQASLDELLAKVPDALDGKELYSSTDLKRFGFRYGRQDRQTLRDFLEGR
jgi:hypothetical protein